MRITHSHRQLGKCDCIAPSQLESKWCRDAFTCDNSCPLQYCPLASAWFHDAPMLTFISFVGKLKVALKSTRVMIMFVNLSIGSVGIFGQSCDSFIQMCSNLTIDKAYIKYIIAKLATIIIRTTYYIFCMRRVVKAQCFESCEVYSRGFESRCRNH